MCRKLRTWSQVVKAVVLATPHSLHAEQIVAVARAGKPVLCEKPLALTGADAARAIAERANGAVVGTALVDALRGSLDAESRATGKTVAAVADLAASLSQGVRGAKKQAAE